MEFNDVSTIAIYVIEVLKEFVSLARGSIVTFSTGRVTKVIQRRFAPPLEESLLTAKVRDILTSLADKGLIEIVYRKHHKTIYAIKKCSKFWHDLVSLDTKTIYVKYILQ